jgi:hypothetical protein
MSVYKYAYILWNGWKTICEGEGERAGWRIVMNRK